MIDLVVDTSVLIEETRRGSEIYLSVIRRLRDGMAKGWISAVILMELWSGGSMSEKDKLEMMEERLSPFGIIAVDGLVAKKAGEIRRKYGINGIDALIAASCLVSGAKLVTLNTKHFKLIKGLELDGGK